MFSLYLERAVEETSTMRQQTTRISRAAEHNNTHGRLSTSCSVGSCVCAPFFLLMYSAGLYSILRLNCGDGVLSDCETPISPFPVSSSLVILFATITGGQPGNHSVTAVKPRRVVPFFTVKPFATMVSRAPRNEEPGRCWTSLPLRRAGLKL